MLSIIIPTLNEEKNIANIENIAKQFYDSEVLLVDGGSKDNTIKNLRKSKFNLIESIPNRGKQLKTGAENSKGKWLFFLHADSVINANNVEEIKKFINKNNQNNANVAYFKLGFIPKNNLSTLIAFWGNLRTRILRLPFGDQGLLIERENYFFIGLHNEIKIMEDIDLITRVPYKNRFLLKSYIITSFRKYKKYGTLKQGLKHIICQFLYFLGVNNKIIYKFYKN